MISLLLRLHTKYSEKPDSYIPIDKRSGMSVSREYRYVKKKHEKKSCSHFLTLIFHPFYRQSRIGDACFFVEKLLDRISLLDDACAASIVNCRKTLWPHYHEEKARIDEEQEKKEALEKKKKAKVNFGKSKYIMNT